MYVTWKLGTGAFKVLVYVVAIGAAVVTCWWLILAFAAFAAIILVPPALLLGALKVYRVFRPIRPSAAPAQIQP